ncbi:GLPGLI family protein [Sphingobacterium siyangense]|uniref:GLPGLI family protein n=1 Tax=Sphingobacterium siyangense TaxID=459529 RepID=UPI001965691F|nr:GLPGLI family protein [Sphingobacterium siyangense]QRY58807.1 GLPGLI family protein [Sphingobacterium siyangense]
MRNLIIVLLLCAIESHLTAQTFRFIGAGRVTYDRIIGKEVQGANKKEYALQFNEKLCSFYAIQNIDDHPYRLTNMVFNRENSTKILHIALQFSLQKFFIKDSLKQIKWYYTNEFRSIEGYQCRRINGLTADSLYVIAFYTEEIPVESGPCLISDTPGLVLGLVIPDLNIQYWAKEVILKDEKIAPIRPERQGTINLSGFAKLIQQSSYNVSQLSTKNIIHTIIY